jgi:hypothetical protein
MPSPFPGMDPYLEGSPWISVHVQLSAEIARQLAPKLRPRYLALTAERMVLEVPDNVGVVATSLYPDIGVTRTGVERAGPAASALAPGPLQLATVVPARVPHVTVEIRDTARRQLVTAIEILSPTNKRGGRRAYLARRRHLLLSTAHLVEIDLLRRGRRVPMCEPLPAAPYFVLVSREEKRPVLDVWAIQFADPLPVVKIPLLPGDADVDLNLQQSLTNVYDLVGYDLAIDYRQPPEVPLPPEVQPWAEERLRAAGLRP